MILLALEFSSARRSVALVEHPASSPGRVSILAATSDQGARAARPLTLIESVLSQAGRSREAVGGVVVGLGPGSYTGIRSAIAVAQGWQLALGTPTFGVSSVDCLALQAQDQGWFGRVNIAIDAQRHEWYLATFEITAEARPLIEPLRLVSLEELQARSAHPDLLLIGPEARQCSPAGLVLFPEAEALGRLAGLGVPQVSAENLTPIYLRETAFIKAPPPRIPPAGS